MKQRYYLEAICRGLDPLRAQREAEERTAEDRRVDELERFRRLVVNGFKLVMTADRTEVWLVEKSAPTTYHGHRLSKDQAAKLIRLTTKREGHSCLLPGDRVGEVWMHTGRELS